MIFWFSDLKDNHHQFETIFYCGGPILEIPEFGRNSFLQQRRWWVQFIQLIFASFHHSFAVVHRHSALKSSMIIVVVVVVGGVNLFFHYFHSTNEQSNWENVKKSSSSFWAFIFIYSWSFVSRRFIFFFNNKRISTKFRKRIQFFFFFWQRTTTRITNSSGTRHFFIFRSFKSPAIMLDNKLWKILFCFVFQQTIGWY